MFIYFGCHRESGHYLFKTDFSYVSYHNHPLPWKKIDGVLVPGKRETEGHIALWHKEGWTCIAFWDRSVDKRNGSNSAFFAHGDFSFDDMKRLAEINFPDVWNRFKFPIVLTLDDGKTPPLLLPVEEKARLFDGVIMQLGIRIQDQSIEEKARILDEIVKSM